MGVELFGPPRICPLNSIRGGKNLVRWEAGVDVFETHLTKLPVISTPFVQCAWNLMTLSIYICPIRWKDQICQWNSFCTINWTICEGTQLAIEGLHCKSVRIGRRRSHFSKVLMKCKVVDLDEIGQVCLLWFLGCLGKKLKYWRGSIISMMARFWWDPCSWIDPDSLPEPFEVFIFHPNAYALSFLLKASKSWPLCIAKSVNPFSQKWQIRWRDSRILRIS